MMSQVLTFGSAVVDRGWRRRAARFVVTIPRSLNPSAFLEYLTLYIGDSGHKVRYPKNRVGFRCLRK